MRKTDGNRSGTAQQRDAGDNVIQPAPNNVNSRTATTMTPSIRQWQRPAMDQAPPRADTIPVNAQVIIDEARRRGISIEIHNAEQGMFALRLAGRTIACHESLTDLTSAIAMTRCSDKRILHSTLVASGIATPDQQVVESAEQAQDFLFEHRRIVLKPARSGPENQAYIDLRTPDAINTAFAALSSTTDSIIAQPWHDGENLRLVVINKQIVAAGVRQAASISGDGVRTIQQLIEREDQSRQHATQGESSIALDAETRRCVTDAGYQMHDVLPYARQLDVRRAATLQSGGVMRDVTGQLPPALEQQALQAAEQTGLQVAGIDMLIEDLDAAQGWVLDVTERPSLTNHDSQPVVEHFMNLLFPQTQMSGPLHRA